MRGIRFFPRGVTVFTGIALAMSAGTAHAENAVHVEWAGYGWSDCTSGTSSGWVCYYDIYSSDCVESAAVGQAVARCDLAMHATVRIVPILNAAGRIVGCTSVGLSTVTDGYVYFDSTMPRFDNPSIDQTFRIDVLDMFGDGKPGAIEFTAVETHGQEGIVGSATWIADGAVAGSCRRNAFTYSDAAAGTMDVQV